MNRVKVTKAQTIAAFRAMYAKHGDCREVAKARFIAAKRRDPIAIHEAWQMYTDGLQKDGYLTQRQVENWSYPF